MTNKIKSLGLAFLAVAAMSAFAASAAQGSELHARTVGANTNITGQSTGNHTFSLGAPENSTIQCTTATFEATAPKTAQELTLTPTLTGCTCFGLACTIAMNGCKYTVTNKLGVQTSAKTATVGITGCTAGKSIEVIASGCTITVPEQHNLSKLTFANAEPAGAKKHVTVTAAVQGITYELDGGLCPPGTGLTHNGTYNGVATFKAFEDNGTVAAQHTSGKTQDGSHRVHEYLKLKCGAQVDLIAT